MKIIKQMGEAFLSLTLGCTQDKTEFEQTCEISCFKERFLIVRLGSLQTTLKKTPQLYTNLIFK